MSTRFYCKAIHRSPIPCSRSQRQTHLPTRIVHSIRIHPNNQHYKSRCVLHSPFLPPRLSNTSRKNLDIPKFHKLIQLRNKLFIQYCSPPSVFRFLQRSAIEYFRTLRHNSPRIKDRDDFSRPTDDAGNPASTCRVRNVVPSLL